MIRELKEENNTTFEILEAKDNQIVAKDRELEALK